MLPGVAIPPDLPLGQAHPPRLPRYAEGGLGPVEQAHVDLITTILVWGYQAQVILTLVMGLSKGSLFTAHLG